MRTSGVPSIPDLEKAGAATWGKTREEALRNIQEVAQMVIESLLSPS
jgi:predicted RNase H-like HicB family nuclease